jgi:acetyl esterase
MAAGMAVAFPDTFEAPPVEMERRVIPGGPNGDLAIHVVRPPGRTEALPAVMYFHGGGWVVCDFSTHSRLVREIAVGAGAAVVFVEYSLSPEVRFPVANEEAYFATKYVAENGSALNIDPSRIAVAGDSAGANMATVVSMLASARGGPAISSAVLFYPVTDAGFESASYNEFADGYFLTRDSMKWFWDNYLPHAEARRHPHVAPLHAPIDQLRGLPPAFLMTCEYDVLRDEGEAYARKLMDAGVRVTSTRSAGTIHGCLTLGPLANTPAVRTAIATANAHLRKTLVG